MLQDLVVEVSAEHGLTEHEARTFIGVAFRRNRAAFKQAVERSCAPELEIVGLDD
jgi:hypothetical protein